MEKFNALYAQSGGVTSVINATACGVIETARQHNDKIPKLYAARNGIIGALTEDLIDTSHESASDVAALRHTPAGAFGSCRHKLGTLDKHRAQYERLVEVFSAHHIRYFFYNGGGDSQDTAHKVSLISQELGYPITCIGVPKTIDNDLPFTDNSPGFGSVAKYVAVSIREAGMDVASMASSSTKVFVLEVMGRHAGWIAAAGGLACEKAGDAPHIILFPEVRLQTAQLLNRVQECVSQFGYCAIVASEGLRNPDGSFVAESGLTDAFGHKQLGGVAPIIAKLIKEKLGFKYHWALADYLQRSARHIASKTDVEQAYAIGKAAVEMALAGKNAVMPIIVRESNSPYRWSIGEASLERVANVEVSLPKNYITDDGFGITEACRQYLSPLIQGEAYPPYLHGLPQYVKLKNLAVEKKLKTNFAIA
ncbi:MAG: 6-phosphofructokinase [Gammaproteobacteria bacterium RIFCSPHIGHO2_12_FULL_41_20]|nr:MAG: 6-phosphofructokinase [Gammaproteobacteria bacterium RIFCSPHIGHO2_12_FULL_41_20]